MYIVFFLIFLKGFQVLQRILKLFEWLVKIQLVRKLACHETRNWPFIAGLSRVSFLRRTLARKK